MVDIYRSFCWKTKSLFVSSTLLFIFFDVVRCDYFPTLYPRESETREVKELNGLWNFRADMSVNRTQGFDDKWYMSRLEKTGPVIPMPVPSSYNDVTQEKSLRDFTGWVWYDKEFFLPLSWKGQRVVVRVDSARYYAKMWINSVFLVEHEMGHLPFEAEIQDTAKFGSLNYLTVAVDNTLTPTTLPPGEIVYKHGNYPPHFFIQNLNFGFFNYAGIDRQVRLYTTPLVHVSDVRVVTDFTNNGGSNTGTVHWTITTNSEKVKVQVEVVDADSNTVAMGEGIQGQATVSNVKLWWPYSMVKTGAAYMYVLQVTVKDSTSASTDIYRQPFGFRTVNKTNTQLLINNKPFYCHGVAKHEDYDLRGKGLDMVSVAKDFNILKWLGVNCFRTSHYPYAEEIMDQADHQGVVVIDESPAIGLIYEGNYGNKTLTLHLQAMRELVSRDKNRPAVIAWSLANEPNSRLSISGPYFQQVYDLTKALDPSRLVTFASSNSNPLTDHAMNIVDIIMVNIYFGWYQDTGYLQTIPYQVPPTLGGLFKHYNKPVMVSEYGAETLTGLHTSPSFTFSEEYQKDLLIQYHQVYDELRKEYLAGEMIWNFADFLIDQKTIWAYGCNKGLFTRHRQPKMAAFTVRERYLKMINETQKYQN
ncbi:beta-glucuronidase-like isoform X2 [Mytilus trossulus]|uniref:beta-glucuronidase-like isoform X2 n=1 Tax=Mytilus trossulus TaxID=6551 RepID=UPI003003D2DF